MTKVYIEGWYPDFKPSITKKLEYLCKNLENVCYYFRFRHTIYPENYKQNFSFRIENVKPDFIIAIDNLNLLKTEKQKIRESKIPYRFIKY